MPLHEKIISAVREINKETRKPVTYEEIFDFLITEKKTTVERKIRDMASKDKYLKRLGNGFVVADTVEPTQTLNNWVR